MNEPKPRTDAQVSKILVMCKELGIDDAARHSFIMETTKRVDSTKELTIIEAANVITRLENMQEDLLKKELRQDELNAQHDSDLPFGDETPVDTDTGETTAPVYDESPFAPEEPCSQHEPPPKSGMAIRPTTDSEVVEFNRFSAQPMTRDQIDLIKRTVARGATDDELQLFLYTAARVGLDPLMKQIYAIKRWNSVSGQNEMTIQTGIDGFRLVADRTGNYAPGRAPTFETDNEGNLLSATAYVQKFSHGIWIECAATAFYSEYVQRKKDGLPNHFWKTMPHSQLAKCAEALALRRAFPAELSHVYSFDEMGQAANPAEAYPASREVKNEAKTTGNLKLIEAQIAGTKTLPDLMKVWNEQVTKLSKPDQDNIRQVFSQRRQLLSGGANNER